MKKIHLLIFLILPSLLFLGCSHESLKASADGGVFRSIDDGKTFEQKVTIDEKTNISNVNISDIVMSLENSNVAYISTINNGMFKTDNSGDTWRQLFARSTVWQVMMDPTRSDTLYIAVTIGGRGKIFKSLDAGENWDEIYSEAKTGVNIVTLGIDNNDPSVLYGGDSQGVLFKSTDAGGRWRVVNKQRSGIRMIRVSRAEPQKVFFVSGGSLFVSTDNGESFQNLPVAQLGREGVSVLEIDPQKSNVLYISSGESIIKSVDGGQTFLTVNTLNPSGPAISNIAVNPNNSNEWFYGSGYAIYRTTDDGGTWSVTQLNTSRQVNIIKINPIETNSIYIGTEKVEKKRGL